ncbi:hypothetical protein D3P06_04925 [Paracoccus aestuarii]|uniref:DUF1311 domain-containing protein n=1 Tax=Paracoccus aestuarii TaxID=453842 RepID=A0A418ZZK3_9RHOB|nr:hypothetical protein [Paracoccus aestuarii]RJL06006.1 hypothetical protein D3P06_04925 [Paracoccus aestuarii]WCQ99090.1 hypothetical protein JHW48_14835 [Paracoccus aestuarii]
MFPAARRHLLAIAFCAAPALPAAAAEFVVIDGGPGMPSIIEVSGPIVPGDADRFWKQSRNLDKAIVMLESPGGDVEEGLSIGAEVHQRGFTAFVPPDGECYSMCAIIWAAAKHRVMDRTSTIGAHAAFARRAQADGSVQAYESGMANADIGAFLNDVGLSRKAIRYFTWAAPDDFNLITPEVAQLLDIDTTVIDGDTLYNVEDRPTPGTIARQTATYMFLQGDCASLLGMDDAFLRQQGEERLKFGHQIFGGEVFMDRLPEMADRIKMTQERMALKDWCTAAAGDLHTDKLPLGISGPSFDCSKASSRTEHAICGSFDLWLQDRALGSLYSVIRSKGADRERADLTRRQRDWIGQRERCGADEQCIADRYNAWFLDLSLLGAGAR